MFNYKKVHFHDKLRAWSRAAIYPYILIVNKKENKNKKYKLGIIELPCNQIEFDETYIKNRPLNQSNKKDINIIKTISHSCKFLKENETIEDYDFYYFHGQAHYIFRDICDTIRCLKNFIALIKYAWKYRWIDYV